MSTLNSILLAVFISTVLIVCSTGYAVTIPSYEAPPVDALTGTVLLQDAINPATAGLTYWCWKDADSDYWYYAYQILNNSQAYNFESALDSKGHYTIKDVSYISKVSVEMGVDGADRADYTVVGWAGSSRGGTAWGATDMSFAPTGCDWSQYGSAEAIHGSYEVKSGGSYNWVMGETSTTAMYYEFVSLWAPGYVHAAVSGPVGRTAASDIVYGPAIAPEPVPEPGVVSILLASLFVVKKRK